jgi:hypothetical protein
VRPEELCQRKIQTTLSEIESAAFRIVPQYQLRLRGDKSILNIFVAFPRSLKGMPGQHVKSGDDSFLSVHSTVSHYWWVISRGVSTERSYISRPSNTTRPTGKTNRIFFCFNCSYLNLSFKIIRTFGAITLLYLLQKAIKDMHTILTVVLWDTKKMF